MATLTTAPTSTLTVLVPDRSHSSTSLHTLDTVTSTAIPPSTASLSGQTSTIWIQPDFDTTPSVTPLKLYNKKHVHASTPFPKTAASKSAKNEADEASAEYEEKLKKFRVIVIIWLICDVLAFLGCIRASSILQRYDHDTHDLSQCLTASPRHARVVVELRDWGTACAITTVLHSITFIVFQYFHTLYGIGHKEYKPLSQTIWSRRKCCNVCLIGCLWLISAVGILALITWPITVVGLMIHADNGLSQECKPINRECWTIISLLIPSIVDFVWMMSSIANDARHGTDDEDL